LREEGEGEREQSRDTEMHRDTQRYTESRREGPKAVKMMRNLRNGFEVMAMV
jgi:hypothetical protein